MKIYSSLAETLRKEWGLVLFSTLVPTAVGIVLVGVLAGSPREIGIPAVVTTMLGLLASIGHLARPVRAPFSIRHWRNSWRSREILLAVTFFIVSALWAAIAWLGSDLTRYLGIASLAVAVTLFFVMGRSYQIWARPAWYGPEIFAELVAVLLIVGITAGELGIISAGAPPSWLGWFGVGGLALGLAIDWWAMRHRLHRLEGLSPDRHNARESLAQCKRQRPNFQIMLLLGVIGLVAATVAVITSLDVIGWSVALASGLVSQLLSRSLFYALPVQQRYVVSLRATRLYLSEQV